MGSKQFSSFVQVSVDILITVLKLREVVHVDWQGKSRLCNFPLLHVTFDPDKIQECLIPYNHGMSLGNWQNS